MTLERRIDIVLLLACTRSNALKSYVIALASN